jgi:hypothetical protein
LKIMRKLLFNYSFYSHPEIGNFRVWHTVSSTLRLIPEPATHLNPSTRPQGSYPCHKLIITSPVLAGNRTPTAAPPLLRRHGSSAFSPNPPLPPIAPRWSQSLSRAACWLALATPHRRRAPLRRRDLCAAIAFLQGLESKDRGYGCEELKIPGTCVSRDSSLLVCVACNLENSYKIVEKSKN